MEKRGQASIEMAIILAAGLIFLAAVLVLNQDTLRTIDVQFRQTRTEAALEDIAHGAELVYQQGVGARTRVYVNFPNGLYNLSIDDTNRSIKIYYQVGGWAYRDFDFNVSGKFSVEEGSRWLALESKSIGVNISDTS